MVPSYLAFSIVSFFLNPVTGFIAILCSVQSRRSQEKTIARRYSDVAYGFAFVGILVSILVVVEVYAFGLFPEHTYYDRAEVIRGVRS